MSLNDTAIVILAAGKGTRMKSDMAKVLHPLNGKPMIQYVVETASRLVGDQIVVVVGHQADTVRHCVTQTGNTRFAEQPQQLGTGHAVQCAMPVIDAAIHTVVVLCGDVPLITDGTLAGFIAGHNEKRRDISVLSVYLPEPTGYGRIVTDRDGHFIGIVEERDATDAQRKINNVNSGIYCIRRSLLQTGLDQIQCNNTQGEYYLTDIIQIGYDAGWCIGVEECHQATEVVGINTLEDLDRVERTLIARNST